MGRLAVKSEVELFAPRRKLGEPSLGGYARAFVREIIRRSGKRIDRIKVLSQMLRHKRGADGEVLVMRARKPLAILEGLFDGPAAGEKVIRLDPTRERVEILVLQSGHSDVELYWLLSDEESIDGRQPQTEGLTNYCSQFGFDLRCGRLPLMLGVLLCRFPSPSNQGRHRTIRLQGQLNKKLVADVIREIAEKRLSGRLSFSQDQTVRSLLFDSGEPVSVSSNLPSEQIEHKLIMDGRATPGLIESARRRDNDSELLGRALVELGVVNEGVMLQCQREIAEQIITGLFEWEDGEYEFEPFERAYGFSLKLSASDCILIGARHVSSKKLVADAYAPLDGLVQVAPLDISHFAFSARLNTTESYVLSRVTSPTRVSEVSALVGMPEAETREAICSLVALGLAHVVSSGEEVVEDKKRGSVDHLLEGIDRKIQFFQSASFYDVLGVPKIATTNSINRTFNELKEMIAYQRSLYPGNAELGGQLDLLLAKMQEAHATLSDPDKRRIYDMPTTRKPPASIPAERGGAMATHRANHPVAQPMPVEQRKPQIVNLPQQAAQLYMQGRSRYDQRDVHAAEHLFREAVRLDPSQPHYHYHLAVTLLILSQARHEHAHHEGCHVTCKIGGGLVSNPRVRYEAEQHLLRAAELDPSNIKVRLTLGQVYKEAGLTKKAESSFREALMLDGGNSIARRELGMEEPVAK